MATITIDDLLMVAAASYWLLAATDSRMYARLQQSAAVNAVKRPFLSGFKFIFAAVVVVVSMQEP